MPSQRRRLLPAVAAVLVAGALLALPAGAQAGRYPTNAGAIFKWGNPAWHDEFETGIARAWRFTNRTLERRQHGMLTLNDPSPGRTLLATVAGHAHVVGRWEARVRSRQYDAGTPYRMFWELVPDNGCRAKALQVATYTQGQNVAQVHDFNGAHTFSATRSMGLASQQWHTYAVEVTRDHISWFVDTHVIHTERRSEALSGVPLNIRFRMQAEPGKRMAKSRLQMDWVRYYTLERKNQRSIAAPQLTMASDPGTC